MSHPTFMDSVQGLEGVGMIVLAVWMIVSANRTKKRLGL